MTRLTPLVTFAWLICIALTAVPVASPSALAQSAPVYYVNPVAGNDNSLGTAPGLAFRTIQHALDIAPAGSTINLAAGMYIEDLTSVRAGTSTAPIVITGPRTAVVRGSGAPHVVEINHSHTVLDGFTIDGAVSGGEDRDKLIFVQGKVARTPIVGVRIRNMQITNGGGECIRFRYYIQNSEIYNNDIGPCGTIDFPGGVYGGLGKNGEAIYIGTAPEQQADGKNPEAGPDLSRSNHIHYNRIDSQGNECAETKENTSYHVIEHNTCTGQKDPEAAGFATRGNNNIFRYNTIINNAGAGVRVGGDTSAQGINNHIYGNEMTNNAYGAIKIQRTPQGYICGNSLSGNGSENGDHGGDYNPAAACPDNIDDLVPLQPSDPNYTVNSTDDNQDSNIGDYSCADLNGNCTLRAALQQTLFDGGNTILFDLPADSTITLNGVLPDITDDLTIEPSASLNLVLDANGGAGFTVTADAVLTLTHLTIINATAPEGGTINNNGTVIAEDLTIRNSTATTNGGAIYNTGQLTLVDCTIDGAAATAEGGAIFNSGGTVILTDCELKNNRAGWGAGVFTETPIVETTLNSGSAGEEASSVVEINDSLLQGNTARERGGGIYLEESSVTVNNSTIDQNSASDRGGGIFLRTNGSLTLVRTKVTQNTTTGNDNIGGGIASEESQVTIRDNSEISENTAERGGGISSRSSSTLTIQDSELAQNRGTGRGGGIYLEGTSNALIQRSQLQGNTSQQDGGAFYVRTLSELVVEDSTLDSNQTVRYGAALFADADNTLTFRRSLLSNNQSINIDEPELRADGGALHIDNSNDLFMADSTVSGNTATGNGGALNLRGGGTAVFSNTTVMSNTADSDNDGVGDGGGFNIADVRVKLVNTIVAGNNDTPGNQGLGSIFPDLKGDVTSLGYNIIAVSDGSTGLVDGENNDLVGTLFSPVDPLLGPLQDNGGTSWTHAPLEGSPAIDNADSSICSASDQLGQPRPGSGSDFCDIGAYELQGTSANLLVRLESQVGTVVRPGQIVQYVLEIANTGTARTENVVLSHTVPTELINPQFTSTGPELIARPDETFIWDVASIGPGERGTITIRAEVDRELNEERMLELVATIDGGTIEEPLTNDNTDSLQLDLRPYQVSFGEASYTVQEDTPWALIDVVLDAPAPRSGVVVDYATVANSATPPDDYTSTSGQLTIGEGKLLGVFIVPIEEDLIAEEDEAIRLTLTPVRGAALGDPETSTLTIIDNDGAGVTITPQTLRVSEDGTTDTYTVKLNSKPTAAVTIDLSTNDEITVAPQQLIFTPNTWNSNQTVTVVAVDDSQAEDTHASAISHTSSSNDEQYDNRTIVDVIATITDNDSASVQFTPREMNLQEGDTGTYEVVLLSPPTSDVIVGINTNERLETSPRALVFTASNWNQPQTVTVTALDNGAIDSDTTSNIQHTMFTDDLLYRQAQLSTVVVNIVDMNEAALRISTTKLNFSPTSNTVTYELTLLSKPQADVIVTLSTRGPYQINPATVTFTPDEWNKPHVVQVVLQDGDYYNEVSHMIMHTFQSSDSLYQALPDSELSTTIYPAFTPEEGERIYLPILVTS